MTHTQFLMVLVVLLTWLMAFALYMAALNRQELAAHCNYMAALGYPCPTAELFPDGWWKDGMILRYNYPDPAAKTMYRPEHVEEFI